MSLWVRIAGDTLRFIRARPGLLAVWSLVNLAGGAIGALAIMPTIERLLRAVPRDAGLGETLSGLLPAFLTNIALFVILATGMMRAVLSPDERRWAYLRVGMAEIRMLGVTVIILLQFYVALLLLAVVAVLIAVALAIPYGQSSTATVAFISIAIVVITILSIWGGVRISPAFPLTFQRKRIIIRDGWRLSKGHAGSLWLGYCLLGLIVVVIMIASLALAGALGVLPPLTSAFDPAAQQAVFAAQSAAMSRVDPASLTLRLVLAALGTLMLALQIVGVTVATVLLAERAEGRSDLP